MKHGQKAKGKHAKAKASGKKSSSKTPTKSAASKKSSAKTSTRKITSSPKTADNGTNRGRIAVEGISFNNPIVAAAFKRAIKKYPSAFRRLTD
jgi:hypothetical protein